MSRIYTKKPCSRCGKPHSNSSVHKQTSCPGKIDDAVLCGWIEGRVFLTAAEAEAAFAYLNADSQDVDQCKDQAVVRRVANKIFAKCRRATGVEEQT